MFGVLCGQGAVMLSYNSTYTVIITNSPCTCILHPAPCILYPIAAPHLCICAYSSAPRYNINLYSYRARAHAPHATTSSCAILPTATEYAPHNLCIPAAAPGTSAMRRQARARAYNTHAHMRDCTIAHTLPIFIHIKGAAQIMRAARHRQQRDAPYRDAACALHAQRTAAVG